MAAVTYEVLNQQVLSASSATVTFSSIPQSYSHLIVEIVGTSTIISGGQKAIMRFNSVSTTSYSQVQLTTNGTTISTNFASGSNDTSIEVGYVTVSPLIWVGTLSIMDYSNTTTYKPVLIRSGESTGTRAAVSSWRSTSAVSTITLSTTANAFASGSIFRIWGLL